MSHIARIVNIDLDIPYGFARNDLLRDRDYEGGTRSVFAVDRDISAHHRYQQVGYRKSKTGPFYRTITFELEPLEAVEELVHIFLSYADACILDHDSKDQHLAFPDLLSVTPAHGEPYGSLVGILDRVREDIYHNLPHAHLVSVEEVGQGLIHIRYIFKPLFGCPERYHAVYLV